MKRLWVAAACSLVLAFSAGAPAASNATARVLAPQNLQALLDPLLSAAFPELKGYTVRLREFNSGDSFFQAKVSPVDALLPAKKRTYFVEYNPVLFEDPPSTAAVEAILTHELAHVADYTRLSAWGLATLGLRYSLSEDYAAAYERRTDERALEKGKAEGLKAYRRWLYSRLSKKALAQKRAAYYTPEQIDAWQAAHPPRRP